MTPFIMILVEDDPGHARLVWKNLLRSGIKNTIIHLDNGEETLDYVFCKGEHKNRDPTEPILLLLDLNLPGINGFQVLEAVRSEPTTAHTPVIILTTTTRQQEVNRCYQLGCNVYLSKPIDYEEFCTAIQQLGLFLTTWQPPEGALEGNEEKGFLITPSQK